MNMLQGDLWDIDWQDLKLKLHIVFRDYSVFPEVLIDVIIPYCAWTRWEQSASTSWNPEEVPRGLTSYQQQLYLCHYDPSQGVSIYNTSGEIIRSNSSFKSPFGIDIDPKKSLIYIADWNHVTILNLNLEVASSWRLPTRIPNSNFQSFRGLKVDNAILYLTINEVHQIFICNSFDGTLLNIWGGAAGSKPSEFNYPRGLAVDNKCVYICDCDNHRIQILKKDKGIFVSQWGTGSQGTESGQFEFPNGIYKDILETIFYVGDSSSVQLFSKDGICFQRLGDREKGPTMNQFKVVYAMCVIEDQLYVSDWGNRRIQIFRRQY